MRGTVALGLLLLLGGMGGSGVAQPRASDGDGRDERLEPTRRATVEAAFARESYRPNSVARLTTWSSGARVSLRLFRAGTELENVAAQDVMLGTAVTPARRVGNVAGGR